MNKRQNAEEDYITTPISVLSYITDLERQLAEALQENDRLKDEIEKMREYEKIVDGVECNRE